MATLVDYSFGALQDVTIKIVMSPPVSVSGQIIRFLCQKRFGGISGLITKYSVSQASGLNNGVSGITIVNSATGIFNISIASQDTSGLNYGSYTYAIENMNSGQRTLLAEGYNLLTPAGPP